MATKRSCNVIVLVSPPSECEWNAIVVRNKVLLCSVLTLWPSLTFEPQNSISITFRVSQDHSLHGYTKFHFGVIRFWVMLRTNRQTDKQTDSKILFTPTMSVSVDNEWRQRLECVVQQQTGHTQHCFCGKSVQFCVFDNDTVFICLMRCFEHSTWCSFWANVYEALICKKALSV